MFIDDMINSYNKIPSSHDDFKITTTIDKNLKPDTIIDVGDQKLTYSELKELFPVKKDEPIRLLVYWDDVCQLVTPPLIDCINTIYGLNAKIDIEHFLDRTNDYVYGIDYCKKIFEKSLPPEEITKFKALFYWKILELSPQTAVLSSITNIGSCITELGFYFSYDFKEAKQLVTDFDKIIFPDRGKHVRYFTPKDGAFNKILEINRYNSVITPNIKSTYDYIINHKLERISIIGPEKHNGMELEILKLLAKLGNYPKPNKCELGFYAEQIITT